MYKFYNQHPLERRLPDCVCRAISLATRTPYEDIRSLLEANGFYSQCEDLNVECYAKLLNKLSKEEKEAENKTVDDLCKEYPDDILVIRIEGHLTCSINGDCYDIWDCCNKTADRYWVM